MDSREKSLDINEILDRISGLIHARSDSQVAGELAVSPQVLSGWRKRNTIPWGKLLGFSELWGASLNWLLTGVDSGDHLLPPDPVNEDEFEEIGRALLTASNSVRQEMGSDFQSFLTGPQLFYVAASIYNKLLYGPAEGKSWSHALSIEISYLINIEKRTFLANLEREGAPPVKPEDLKDFSGDQADPLSGCSVENLEPTEVEKPLTKNEGNGEVGDKK